MAHDVFISHSSKDGATASLVCGALEGAGIRCWIAPRDIAPGAEWLGAIVEAIHTSRLIVLIVSSHAIDSPQVEREVVCAVNQRVPVLPVRIEAAVFSRSFEYLLSVPQWLDAATPPLEQHLPYLAEAVRRLLLERTDRATNGIRAGEPEPVEQAERVPPRGTSTSAATVLAPKLPPPTTHESRPNNLPAQPTTLIGREQELRELQGLLERADVRLVTLTGPGGTGKTRLGLQVAAALLDRFSGGAYVVFLAPIRDPNLVASAIAQKLGVREEGSRGLLESLKEYLREREMLLLLDNFEQVMEGVPLVAELLASCPRLKILATSREALHLRGEQEFAVPPLDLPDLKRLPPAEELSHYAAVELFMQRALAVKRDFTITNETAPAVAEICVRLDGLPLAIELAAARIKLLPPEAMLARLVGAPLVGGAGPRAGRPQGSPLRLLTVGARDLPERHQTLRGAIAWSYDLLEEAEKILFRRLAVFAGRWTLEAAEMVCDAADDLPVDVLDGLGSLVDKSLVRPSVLSDEEPRFWMLATIREYGSECLAASGEEAAIRRQHVQFFLGLSEQAEPGLLGAGQAEWLDRLESEHDNLRAAMEWSVENGAAEAGLRLGAALWRFWHVRGHLREGRDRLEAVLAMPGASAYPLPRARALNGAGALADDQGDFHRAAQLHEESLAIARECDDKETRAYALLSLGHVAIRQGRYEQAKGLYEEALALWRSLDNQTFIAALLHNLGNAASYLGQSDEAIAFFEESLALKRKLGNQSHIASTLNNLGYLAIDQGNYERAAALLHESLYLYQKLGNSAGICESLNNIARLALEQGDLPRAACLLTKVRALSESIGALLSADHERNLAVTRAGLSQEAFAAAWSQGQAMTLEEAIAYGSAAADRV